MKRLVIVVFILISLLSLNLWGREINLPIPELADKVEVARQRLSSPTIQRRARNNRAFNALYIQTLNHLKHISFSFEKRDATYTHDFVLLGPYPDRPTQMALQRVDEFFEAIATEPESIKPIPENKSLEKYLLKKQKDLVRKITNDSMHSYLEMKNKLLQNGHEASFAEELGPVVDFLEYKLLSDASLLQHCGENSVLSSLRKIALRHLRGVKEKAYPYLSTIEAIQRTLEFYDVYRRAVDPSRSPKLYHSDRYDYYGHYLKGELPDHITIPTLVSLGATDILKARGVPIGFIGVNTDISWVDGYYQTPYEFWVHDINHSRRMYLFFKESAEALGLTIDEFARQSDEFVKTRLIPIITIQKEDDEETKNKKRLIKILLFEILHEDALAATPEIVKTAVLRPPNLITPFERIEGSTVQYIMEPGATTLAYVFRKLAHDFYDMPGVRLDNIVAEQYRTRERIVEAAETLFSALGFSVRRDILEYFVSTDQGFPADFKQTIKNDISARPNQTVPLDQEEVIPTVQIREIVAELFHSYWQTFSGYDQRWKVAHGVFQDGTGINDGINITTEEQKAAYLEEQKIPTDLHQYFQLKPEMKTGMVVLHEDIQHLPHQLLAPNNQYENIMGASSAVDLVEEIVEKKIHFDSVDLALEWLKNSCQKMNLEWLKRNNSWAKLDPQYKAQWSDLAASKQKNNVLLFKIAFETINEFNPGHISISQQVLLAEAIRRLELEIGLRAKTEIRVFVAGNRIHENWQRKSGYKERWKPADARLWDGTPVTNIKILSNYLLEKKIPQEFHRFFRFQKDGSDRDVLFEDIQNLPNDYLAPNHQTENLKAGALVVDLVDRIWSKKLKFRTQAEAERWLVSAAQTVHQGVLDRNANGARDNPIYNQHWSMLPAVNQQHDLDHVRIAFEAHASIYVDGLEESQRKMISKAFDSLADKIKKRKIKPSCKDQVMLEKPDLNTPPS
ncbi:MAG: hypothetical protein AB7F43_07905 [Bacteriovoracia bacterium]